ncbi:hypothetical protein F2Q69_00027954 [Brassica cretica]|uniref:Uncharacterized protein n=1 Tax=Brassica cretica TaxID=69181 RepID=A0A8S9S0E4_BRACR|nr:hypothetical protein F2Q69_00027954 [Brassica cretica]
MYASSIGLASESQCPGSRSHVAAAQLQQAVDMRGGGGVWAQDGRAEEEGLLCAVGNIGLEDKGSDGGDVTVSASKYLPGM